jgi:hypothetical protein
VPVANAFCRQLRPFRFPKCGKDADVRRGAILWQAFGASPLAVGEIGLDGLGYSVGAGGGRRRTVKAVYGLFLNAFNNEKYSLMFAKVRVIPLSRRKHGFDPRWARHGVRKL